MVFCSAGVDGAQLSQARSLPSPHPHPIHSMHEQGTAAGPPSDSTPALPSGLNPSSLKSWFKDSRASAFTTPAEIPSMGPTPRISPGLLITDSSPALYCYWTRVLVCRFSCVISYLPSSRKWQRLCFARPYVSLSTQHRWLRLCWLSNSTGMMTDHIK